MIAEGLLGDIEPFGCFSKIQFFRSYQEIFQIEKINHLASSLQRLFPGPLLWHAGEDHPAVPRGLG